MFSTGATSLTVSQSALDLKMEAALSSHQSHRTGSRRAQFRLREMNIIMIGVSETVLTVMVPADIFLCILLAC